MSAPASPTPKVLRGPMPVEYWEIPEDAYPDVENIVIDDGAPVDGLISEKNMRLLTEPLFASWPGPGDSRPFIVMADVGVFHTKGEPGIVPDVLLAIDLAWPTDLSVKDNQSYFVWFRGKVPDVAIEIVSNREGGEDSEKMKIYERIRVTYYAIFDPEHYLSDQTLRVFALSGGTYEPISGDCLEGVGLGLKVWDAEFEGIHRVWLRWCDPNGNFIPTGVERAEQERQRAEVEQQRAEQERQRAEVEQQRAEQERQRAEAATQELERLRAELRARGIDLPS